MKILIIGDQHLRYELPYGSSVPDGRRKEWEEVKEVIRKEAETCHAIVLLGDNFNSRHNHSSVIREFIDFLNGFGDKEVHILVGNHERYGTSTALDFIKNIQQKNWFVYTEPKLTTICGSSAMMVPFMTPALLGAENKEEGVKALMDKMVKAPMAFIHHGISGSKAFGVDINLFNEIVLSQEGLAGYFDQVFAGHIHDCQVIGPDHEMVVTGNVFCESVGEHKKMIWTYEVNPGSTRTEQVVLPCRGIYKMIWENKGAEEIPAYSIVKCYVTSRETKVEDVKKFLNQFDASIIIEQYPNERSKVHFESGSLDLSMDGLLKLYADAKKISYSDLKYGFDLINNTK